MQSTIAKETNVPESGGVGAAAVDHEQINVAIDGEEETKTPTLENLLRNLESANSHPNRALEFLKQLNVDADKIKQKQKVQN